MRCKMWVGILLVALIVACPGLSSEPPGGQPTQDGFFKRLAPVGGWCPDAGGLLHWWNPDCFPRCSTPDDYCRKPQPKVCWPAYPSSSIWAPPEIGHPQNNVPRDRIQPNVEK